MVLILVTSWLISEDEMKVTTVVSGDSHLSSVFNHDRLNYERAKNKKYYILDVKLQTKSSTKKKEHNNPS